MKPINIVLSVILSIAFSNQAFALPENTVESAYATTIVPFLATGQTFNFTTDDGLSLSGVHFDNPGSHKTIVVVNGRIETWLKYGEVFYDLYQKGYSIYSYDHRGQGLSPHLSSVSPEIGYVRHYHSYISDLNTFVTKVVIPNQKQGDSLFLLAHSMGGAVAAGYLSEYPSPFKNAVLSCPMLEINTKPYPEFIADGIVIFADLFGQGQKYARNQVDYQNDLPLSKSLVTSSEARWWLNNKTYDDHPSAVLGGPSNRWVFENILMGQRVRSEMKNITTPFIMFQAGLDQLVMPKGENDGCSNAGSLCTQIKYPNSQHEILFEQDSIRDNAMSVIENQFQ